MNGHTQSDYAALVLRLSLGVMYLAHSVLLKGVIYGMDGTVQFFASIGYPAWMAYAVTAAEAVGGALLILGVQTRWVALALIPVLLGATAFHWGNGWVFSAPNGGWEYPVFLIVASIVQALLGSGAYALAAGSRRPALATA